MRNPLKAIKAQISDMKADGNLETGELISPYSVKSHRIDSQSNFFSETLEVPSRKIPLDTPLQHEIEREIKQGVLNI